MTTASQPAGTHDGRPHPDPAGRLLVRLMAAASLLRVGETEAGLRSLRLVVAAWPEDPLPRYRLAVALAGSGHGQEALDALAGAVAAGLASAGELEAEDAFDDLRRDPRFLAAVSGARCNGAGRTSGGGEGA